MSEPMAPLGKPYTYLPPYADVSYVDGKLRVCRGVIPRSHDAQKRRRWQQTVDILLDQRLALLELAQSESAPTPESKDAADE